MTFPDLVNPYAYLMAVRRFLYKKEILRSQKIPVPVIAVGNLSAGGTGKTPLTLWIANYCLEHLKKKTAIVLRGYKRKSSGYVLVSNGANIIEPVTRSGDEAQLYAQELPKAIVICDEDRVHGSLKATESGAEIIILDDAFQHLAIKRDINILVINADEGTPAVLPFGRGREQAYAMEDADMIVLSNTTPDSRFEAEKPVIRIRTAVKNSEKYRDKKILAFCGIANPDRFKKTLESSAREVIGYSLPDHVDYSMNLLETIVARSRAEQCDLLVTTTKDAVKMLALYHSMQEKDISLPQLAVVRTEIDFLNGKEILEDNIKKLFV